MYKYILKSVEGIDWMAIIPLVIFFTTFVVVVAMILLKSREDTERLARMPLDE